MSIMSDFNITEYVTDGKLLLENHNIKNCRITGKEFTEVFMKNCVFENVIFQNHTKKSFWTEECEFINCQFHDTFRGEESYDVLLVLMHNVFVDCMFEDIDFYGYDEQSEILHSKFENCKFKKLHFEGTLAIASLTINGGNIESFSFKGNEIRDNCVENLQLQDLDLMAAVYYNKLEKVVFKDVKLTGNIHDNEFINCDKSGFAFVEDDNW